MVRDEVSPTGDGKKSIESVEMGLTKTRKISANRETIRQAIVQHLRIVVKTTQAHSRWIEKQSGVSSVQLWAMWQLFAEPGQKVSDLSKALSIHQSTASNMLDKLEDKKLIRRDRSGPDQRVVQLYLTAKGAALLSNAPRPAQGPVTDALHHMTDEELHQLQSGLQALIQHMSDAAEDGALTPILHELT
ncbi:MarR family winged helix-turn-helix transcriptional regulator [Kaarinaea lacus]